MKGKVVEGVTIYTNNVPRELIQWWQLTPREQKEFDYLDTEERQEGAVFFRYKGRVYSMDEFLRPGTMWMPEMPDAFKEWDSYASDSFFSGVLLKFARDEYGNEDYERVVIGWYCS